MLQDIANEVDVPSGEDDSLMYSHNQVKIKKANAAGKNYVGIAALNNTCHGISNMIDVRFKTMFDFNIDGITRDMVMQQDESGTVSSKSIRYTLLSMVLEYQRLCQCLLEPQQITLNKCFLVG